MASRFLLLGWLLLASALFAGRVEAAPVVALLPLSGEQAAAGREVLKGMRAGLAGQRVVAVDRNLYPTLGAAWKAVMAHQPSLVVGPLAAEDVSLLPGLSPAVPVIALNRVGSEPAGLIWHLDLSVQAEVQQMVGQLLHKGVERLLVLMDVSVHAQRRWLLFKSLWPQSVVDVVRYEQSRELPSAISVLMHSPSSRTRLTRLREVLPELTAIRPWVRQDADAVLLLTPLADALELSHRVDYLWGQDYSLLWLDSGQSGVEEYVRSLPNWGRMQTMMPTYLMLAMQERPMQLSNFFHALGQDVARLVQVRLASGDVWDDGAWLEGSLGAIRVSRSGRIQVSYPLVWLADGRADPVRDHEVP